MLFAGNANDLISASIELVIEIFSGYSIHNFMKAIAKEIKEENKNKTNKKCTEGIIARMTRIAHSKQLERIG